MVNLLGLITLVKNGKCFSEAAELKCKFEKIYQISHLITEIT